MEKKASPPLRPASAPQGQSLILAFDIGTSSLRTSLFTHKAERLVHTTAQETYPLTTTADGGAEFPPDLLREAAIRCILKTLGVMRSDPALANARIVGIGTSCFWHSLVGIGEGNSPITPVITWADSRCLQDSVQLRKDFDERTIHALTGCMLRASFWPAKLLWLRRTQGATFAKVRQWLSPAEWLQREFCGDAPCAFGMATGTGLFNPTTLTWVPELLEHCGIREEQLGSLSDAPTCLLEAWGEQFPELAGVPWYPGIGDGAASNLGSGATQPGLAAINVGTSAALRVMTEGKKAEAPYGLFCYRVDEKRFLVGGAVSNAGNLRAWCLREWILPGTSEEIERELHQRPTPEHGLVVLPFWTAERAPTWRDDMQGAIVGFTQHTTAIDVLQATTEAVYYRLARIAEMVAEHEGSQPKFIVSGGIQKSPASIERFANVLNAPLYPNDEAEASIRGAAVFVAEKLGEKVPPFNEGKPVQPNAAIAKRYLAARQEQAKLEALLGGSKMEP